jgi:hypothetical protein
MRAHGAVPTMAIQTSGVVSRPQDRGKCCLNNVDTASLVHYRAVGDDVPHTLIQYSLHKVKCCSSSRRMWAAPASQLSATVTYWEEANTSCPARTYECLSCRCCCKLPPTAHNYVRLTNGHWMHALGPNGTIVQTRPTTHAAMVAARRGGYRTVALTPAVEEELAVTTNESKHATLTITAQ